MFSVFKALQIHILDVILTVALKGTSILLTPYYKWVTKDDRERLTYDHLVNV